MAGGLLTRRCPRHRRRREYCQRSNQRSSSDRVRRPPPTRCRPAARIPRAASLTPLGERRWTPAGRSSAYHPASPGASSTRAILRQSGRRGATGSTERSRANSPGPTSAGPDSPTTLPAVATRRPRGAEGSDASWRLLGGEAALGNGLVTALIDRQHLERVLRARLEEFRWNADARGRAGQLDVEEVELVVIDDDLKADDVAARRGCHRTPRDDCMRGVERSWRDDRWTIGDGVRQRRSALQLFSVR